MVVGVIAYFRRSPRSSANDATSASIGRARRFHRVLVVEAALAHWQKPFAIAERDAIAFVWKGAARPHALEHDACFRRQLCYSDLSAVGNGLAGECRRGCDYERGPCEQHPRDYRHRATRDRTPKLPGGWRDAEESEQRPTHAGSVARQPVRFTASIGDATIASAGRLHRVGRPNANVKLAKLRLGRGRRRVDQQILAALRLRKGDDVADRFRAGH